MKKKEIGFGMTGIVASIVALSERWRAGASINKWRNEERLRGGEWSFP